MAGEMAALASVGLGMLTGAANRTTQRARNRVADAEAAAANLVRKGRNEQAAAEGGLARWMQGENNKRRLQAAGEQFNAGQQTLSRMQDSAARGSLEDQIAAAEAAGAYTANTAFSGAAGASVDIVDMALQLRNDRALRAREVQQGFATYDTLQQIAGIMPQATAGLAIPSGGEAPLDYSVNLSQAQVVQGNFLLDFARGLAQQPEALNAFGGTPQSARTPTTGDFARMDRGQGSWFNASESSVRLK